jgi:hypothetical protein
MQGHLFIKTFLIPYPMPDKYRGTERRKGMEFRVSVDDDKHPWRILKETGYDIYSSPVFFEFFRKRTMGPNGYHFIPRKGNEPSGLSPSGALSLSVSPYQDRKPKNLPSHGKESKYSLNIYPERRSPRKPPQRKRRRVP